MEYWEEFSVEVLEKAWAAIGSQVDIKLSMGVLSELCSIQSDIGLAYIKKTGDHDGVS